MFCFCSYSGRCPLFYYHDDEFYKIIIVLSFCEMPWVPSGLLNQILVGLALILTLFIMSPVIAKVNADAYQPYPDGAITREEAFDKAQVGEGIYAETDGEKRAWISLCRFPKRIRGAGEHGRAGAVYGPGTYGDCAVFLY